MPQSWVYVIGPAKGPVKIGISVNPEYLRLAQLQTGHPYKLSVIAQMPGSEAEEAACHLFLGPWRLEGEWFHRGYEVKDFIDYLSGGLPIPLALKKLEEDRRRRMRLFADGRDVAPKTKAVLYRRRTDRKTR